MELTAPTAWGVYILLLALSAGPLLMLHRYRLWIRALPVTVFLISLIACHFLGSIYVFIEYLRLRNGVYLFSWRYVYILGLELILAYAVAFGTLHVVARRSSQRRPVKVQEDFQISTAVIVGLMWLSALGIVALYTENYGLPLLFRFESIHPELLLELRTEQTMTADFHRYVIGFCILPAFCSSAIYANYLLHPTPQRLLLFLLSSGMAMILALAFYRKSYAVELFTCLFLTKWYVTGRLNLRRVLIVGAVAFALVLVLYVPYHYHEGLEYFLATIPETAFRRISFSYTQNLAATMLLVPDSYDWFGGATFPNPRGVFWWERVNWPNELFEYVKPERIALEPYGTAPVGAIGEFYANFGWSGAIAAAVLIYMTLMVLLQVWLRQSGNPVQIAILVTYLLHACRVHQLGLFNTLLSPLSLALVAALYLVWVLRNPPRRLPANPRRRLKSRSGLASAFRAARA